MIKVKKLQKSFGSLTVLFDVSFSLGRGQKVALVGHNGTGKTTLMRIVAGLEQSDAGVIEIAKSANIGYLAQDTSLTSNVTIIDYLREVTGVDALEREIQQLASELDRPEIAVQYEDAMKRFEYIDGYTLSHRAEAMLVGFGLNDVELDRPISQLSSGQKSKVALIGILLKGVDILLLDEPTNNLDIPALVWLEDFLKRSTATCIIVSHDRRFLDKVATSILDLDWHTHTVTVTGGSYSDYILALESKIARQNDDYHKQQEEIDRLTTRARESKASALRGASWSPSDNDKHLRGFKRDKAAKAGKVAKAIEKRIEHMDMVERPFERKPFAIPLDVQTKAGNRDISLRDVVASNGNDFTVGPLSVDIPFGERIAILGNNGVGKSTLLNVISGRTKPTSGAVKIGSAIRIGNMMQEHDSLPRKSLVLDYFGATTGFDLRDSHTTLAQFGFDERQARMPIGALSPGGRARLLLALFSAQSVNVLILDEPTNHLDVEAQQALEETLRTYQGTVIMVTHDRFFLETSRLDATFVLSDGTLTKIPDYRSYVAEAEVKAKKLLRLLS